MEVIKVVAPHTYNNYDGFEKAVTGFCWVFKDTDEKGLPQSNVNIDGGFTNWFDEDGWQYDPDKRAEKSSIKTLNSTFKNPHKDVYVTSFCRL